MKFKIALWFLLAGGLFGAFSATPVAYPIHDNINEVYLKGETQIYFSLTVTYGISGTTIRWYVVDRVANNIDPDNFDKIHALLVTAQQSGKKIYCNFDGANISVGTPDGNTANLMSNTTITIAN
jgi:hypothetical protein